MEEIDSNFQQDKIEAYTDFGHVEFDRTKMKPLSHGKYGEVYDMQNGYALKRYFNSKRISADGARNTAKVIRTIKNLKLGNMYSIAEILYSGKYKLKKEIIGYTMKKYDTEDIDFTQVDINYIINNYNQIKEDFLLLAKNNITVRDLHTRNVIITQDKIIIIDADNYLKSIFGGKSLSEGINISQLNSLFTKLLIESYYAYHREDPYLQAKIRFLQTNFRSFPDFIEELKHFSSFDEFLTNKLENIYKGFRTL